MRRLIAILMCLACAAAWAADYKLWVPDDYKIKLGTDSDFNLIYDSAQARLELNDSAGNTLGYWVDNGTTGALVVSDAAYAQLLNLAHRTAPASPANGDVWTTSAGLYVRVNGVTVGPMLSAATLPAPLAAIAALATTDGNIIVGDGSTWVAESGATARTSLGLGSIATQAANNVAITGGSVTGITDVAVADGGTGASDAATARTNLGLGTMATQAANAVAITGGSISGLTSIDGTAGATSFFATPTTPTIFAGASTGFTMGHASGTNTFNGAASNFGGTLSARGGAGISLLAGSDHNANTLTNATTKIGRIATPHYLTAEEPLLLMVGASGNSANEVYIGGSQGGQNAATIIGFYTSPNTTTLTGTKRLDINSAGLVRAYANAQVDGNTQLGDSTADRFSVNTTPLTNKAAVIQGDLTVYKGSVPFDTALNSTDLGIYNPDYDSRLILAQGSSDYAILSWDRNATPANAELRLEIPNGQAFRFLEGGNLVKAGTGNITWNETTGYIRGAALNANSVTDSQLSSVATAGTYNGVTITAAGRVTSIAGGSHQFVMSDGLATAGSPASGTSTYTRTWAYDDATDEAVTFSCALPYSAYGASKICANINWHAAATTGAVRWQIGISMAGDSGTLGSFTTSAKTDTVTGTTNRNNITFFDDPDWLSVTPGAVGALVAFTVTRDADNVLDTMTGDAIIDAVQIFWD